MKVWIALTAPGLVRASRWMFLTIEGISESANRSCVVKDLRDGFQFSKMGVVVRAFGFRKTRGSLGMMLPLYIIGLTG
jgi:hypothetical protein